MKSDEKAGKAGGKVKVGPRNVAGETDRRDQKLRISDGPQWRKLTHCAAANAPTVFIHMNSLNRGASTPL